MVGSRGGADFVFSPIGLHVEPGTTVTFRIVEGVHSSTAYHPANGDSPRIPEAAEPWNSGTFAMGTYEHAFEVHGTYDYYCIPHRPYGMVGRIVCGSPGGPAEGSTPPDGRVPESGRIVSEGSVSASAL